MERKPHKNKWRTGFEWAFLILAYLFLLYKMLTYDQYALFLQQFFDFSLFHWLLLLLVILLMPFNLFLEAVKWKHLISPIVDRPIAGAYHDVFKGLVAAFATPNRIGEFPGRSLWMSPNMQIAAIMFGFIGSFIQTIIIFSFGFASACHLLNAVPHLPASSIYIAFFAGIVLIGVTATIYYNRKLRHQAKQILDSIKQFQLRQLITVITVSIARYAVFAFQLYLMLICCDIPIQPLQAVIAIPAYYFLVTFTPSISASEPAVRGSWAMIAFAPFSSNAPGIALSVVFLWIINGVIPMLIGSLLRRQEQQ